jgi:hypothetical protein
MVTGQSLFLAKDESKPIGESPRTHHNFSLQDEIILKSNSKGKYHMAGTSIANAIHAHDQSSSTSSRVLEVVARRQVHRTGHTTA